jgi:hypothetical protein
MQDTRGKCGLAVVNVADGANVDVWFVTIECVCHFVI